jgi:hypothetical protein
MLHLPGALLIPRVDLAIYLVGTPLAEPYARRDVPEMEVR